MIGQYLRFSKGIILLSFLVCIPTQVKAQIIPDNTLPENSIVTPQGDIVQIEGGTTRGTNLFHSFTEFSVPINTQAVFNNIETIDNILSRVTGDRESIIDGGIGARGTANVFLINPAGIIFGENAFLDIGGSFIGSTADGLLFPDGIEYSATNLENPPILTINAPIGLGFRDNPGDIVNSSMFDNGTDFEDLVGLRVFEDSTLALIGGNVLIDGGFLSTVGGRIELGSVAGNSTVNITPVEKGFDFSYENVSNFQDISLAFAAAVNNLDNELDTNPGDINVQGRNVSLVQGSVIGITAGVEGQTGDINIIAAESLILDGNGLEVDLENFGTKIFSDITDNATGEESSINIDTPQLNITNGAQIATTNDLGNGRGVDIKINASEILLERPFFIDDSNLVGAGILAQVFEEGTGDGGEIDITTEKLTINDGAQINSDTFGSGNGGDVIINASESIELNGTIPDDDNNFPSSIFANVGIPLIPISTAGNGGNITITSPQLTINDGAQIGTTALNDGNGGNLTLNIADSISLTGTSPGAELGGEGRSGIFVSVQPSYEEFIRDFDTGEDTFTGEIITTTGKGGSLTLDTSNLTIESGAVISADTFSLGDGGDAEINVNRLILRDGGRISAGSSLEVEAIDTQRGAGGELDITATESIEITGIGDINDEPVTSSIFSLGESNGTAGSATLTTNQLSISNGGEINVSAIASGGAGTLDINADRIDLTQGSITAATNGGDGGIITLDIAENLILKDNSFVSASAFGDANGGNLSINSNFIIAFPSQVSGNGNDIIANAGQGNGGNITITAESLFGIQERNATTDNKTNDIDASSARGAEFNGIVNINTPDTNVVQTDINLPRNLVQTDRTNAQACRRNRELAAKNEFTITGKGGILPEPGRVLNSLNVLVNGESTSIQVIPTPIETAKGKIQPARGIKITESGGVILTAYRTNNSGERLPETRNCI